MFLLKSVLLSLDTFIHFYDILMEVKGCGFMKLGEFEKQEVLECAMQHFPDHYIEYIQTDLYLRGLESGFYESELYEDKMYVSTEYAYHCVPVQGNMTNVKVVITCVLVKKDKYEIIYDSLNHYYAVMKENEGFIFIRYDDFLKQVTLKMKKIEESNDEW